MPVQSQQQKKNVEAGKPGGGDGEDHGGADRRDDATGPLQDGQNRGNTTRGNVGGGDDGASR